jgi:small neutral amino acid transporter SnatA (MarC family)
MLPIVNPFGMAPIFAEMTLWYSTAIRRTMAMRVAVNCTVLLVASLFW